MMKTLILLLVFTGVSLGLDRYNVYQRKTCPLNNIEIGNYEDVRVCLQKCDSMKSCVAVERNRVAKTCTFKRACDLTRLKFPKCPCTLYAKPQDVYEIEPGNDCVGNIIKKLNNVDVAECIDECDGIHECVGFFRNHPNTCFLRKECNDKEIAKRGNLYLNKLGQYQYYPKADCPGNTILDHNAQSVGECKWKCENTKACVAVVYNPENGSCKLKSQCSDLTEGGDLGVYVAHDSTGFRTEQDCRAKGNDCIPPQDCDKQCPGKCPGIGTVCCCRRKVQDCESLGGSCKLIQRCTPKDRCPNGSCNRGKVCCKCKDTIPEPVLGKTCASRGNVCTRAGSSCKLGKCEGTCPGSKICCCGR